MANAVTDAILRGRKTIEGVVEGGLNTVETVVEAGLNTVDTVVDKGRQTVESAVSLGRRTVENTFRRADLRNRLEGFSPGLSCAHDCASRIVWA